MCGVASAGKLLVRPHTLIPEQTKESPEKAEISLLLRLTDGTSLTERVSVGADGVTLTGEGTGAVLAEFPVFLTDGETQTEIRAEENRVTVSYRGWKAVWSSDGTIRDTGETYANRNGLYRRFVAEGKERVRLRIGIFR